MNRNVLSYLTLLLSGFCLTANYGIIRPAMDSLFLVHFDATDRLWGMAALPVLVTLLLWPYNFALARFGARRTVAGSTALSGACLLVPGLLLSDWAVRLVPAIASYDGLLKSAAFGGYLIKEVYMVFLVEQFWSFATSSNTVEGGKKYFGGLLIMGGLGGMAGNKAQALLATSVGTAEMTLLALLLLVPFWLLISTAYTLSPAQGRLRPKGGEREVGVGIRQLLTSRYLVLIALVVGLGQMMVACLDVVFHDKVLAAYPALDQRSVFLADVWFYINGGATLMQIVTPVVLRLFSVRILHIVLPVSHLATVGASLAFPFLATAAFAFAWFKAVDYSLFRACKDLLYVPLDFSARYRVKMLIDFVIYRSTKATTALALAALRSLSLVSLAFFPVVALAAAAVWVAAGASLGSQFSKLASRSADEASDDDLRRR